MARHKSPLRAALLSLAALFPVSGSQAQVVETVKEYTITIESGLVTCENVQTVGELCGPDLDIVYVGGGLSGRRLFTTTSPLPATNWNDGNSTTFRMRTTNIRSGVFGESNTAALVAADANSNSGKQDHRAATACANLSYGGYDDWYLPAVLEAHIFFLNADRIPVSPGNIWTSSETRQTAAYAFNAGTGALTSTLKSSSLSVRCVRSGDTPVVPAKSCDTVTEVGETCGDDGVVYAGKALSGQGLFATTFLLPSTPWNNGQTTNFEMIRTNVLSGVNGAANTVTLASADADRAYTGTQVHAAANYCENMSYGGYSDWYLPASAEARTLFLNRADLPVKTGEIWTSTEYSQTAARSFDIGSGEIAITSKSTARPLMCVRRGPVPAQAETPCEGLTAVGQTCGGGDVVLAGESLDGGRMFTTSFVLPAHTWNNGQNTTFNMRRTGRTSGLTGASNTAALATLDSDGAVAGTQPHAAAEVCESMTYGGYGDWYLPAAYEAYELYRNRSSLPVTSGEIWTSTERSTTGASALDLATGDLTLTSKSDARAVQCVRKSAAPLVAATDCSNVTAVGGICGNGNVVLAGESLSGGRLFTTTTRIPAATWNNGQTTSFNMSRTNITSGIDGAANTTALAVLDADNNITGTQPHDAAAACDGMTFGGYDDWHLPASYEAYELYRNRGQLPAGIGSGVIWTSTEVSQTTASAFDVGAGTLSPTTKSTSRAIQCVRTEEISFGLAQSCEGVEEVGEACGGGRVVYAGEAPSGDRLFTTNFALPAATWNNGQTTSFNMSRTNITSGIDGAANTTALAALDADNNITGTQPHVAASVCEALNYAGFDDWYLPASGEVSPLHVNKASLPVKTGEIWTSTETSQSSASLFDIESGEILSTTKSTSLPLVCVRKKPGLPVEPDPEPEFVRLYTDVIPGLYAVSNDGLTMTRTGSDTDYRRWMKADVQIPKTDQTYYWEVALSGGGSTWNGYIGVVSEYGDSRYLQTGNPIYGDSIGWRGNGTLWGDGSETNGDVGTEKVSAGSSWTYGNGDVLMLAFNPKSGAFWIGKNGVWRNSPAGSPTYDINGANDFLGSYAVPSLQGRSGSGESLTLRSAPSQFSYPVPSGAVPLADLAEPVPVWNSASNLFKSGDRDPRDIFGWAGIAFNNNATTARDSSVTDSPIGGTPLRMSVTGPDPHIGTYHFGGVQNWNIAPAADGETWEVRVFAKASAPTSIQLFIFGTDAAGVWSTQPGTLGVTGHAVGTEWREYSYQFTFANAGIQAMQTRLDGPDAGEAVDIWFDGLQVYKVE